MTRPTPELIARVDEVVAKMNARLSEEEDEPVTTVSYEEIFSAWEEFKLLVDELDAAVANPFAPGAGHILCAGGERLEGLEVYKLAVWLSHVGMALTAA